LVPIETAVEPSVAVAAAVEIDAGALSIRELNTALKDFAGKGVRSIVVSNPAARHNIAVGILEPVRIRIAGSVGYYCAGLMDGAHIEIEGSAGWGLAESMLDGYVKVRGNAGNGAAAAVRGGTVVILGDAGARLGVSLKGGLIVVAGNCGYMAGFMAQKGTMIVCGDTGQAFADSMYETVCYVGGAIGDLGTDAVEEAMEDEDVRFLQTALCNHLPPHPAGKTIPDPARFRKVVSGRKLWRFDKEDWKLWQEAL
jgi:glutamate synthase domain-containing protein 3